MLRAEVLLRPPYVRTSNQGTHRANANTITPAQYQPRSASSLIGSSFLFLRDYTPILRAASKAGLVSSLLLNGATMSQQSSLTQSAHSVRQVLTAYRPSNTEKPVASCAGSVGFWPPSAHKNAETSCAMRAMFKPDRNAL